jgi:ABC-type dipeptide/oligopeptide/nickel transport system permease subunit
METTLLIKFFIGVLIGFLIAYPIGLWAGYYTDWVNKDGK